MIPIKRPDNECRACGSNRTYRKEEYDVCMKCNAITYDGDHWIARDLALKATPTVREAHEILDFFNTSCEVPHYVEFVRKLVSLIDDQEQRWDDHDCR